MTLEEFDALEVGDEIMCHVHHGVVTHRNDISISINWDDWGVNTHMPSRVNRPNLKLIELISKVNVVKSFAAPLSAFDTADLSKGWVGYASRTEYEETKAKVKELDLTMADVADGVHMLKNKLAEAEATIRSLKTTRWILIFCIWSILGTIGFLSYRISLLWDVIEAHSDRITNIYDYLTK